MTKSISVLVILMLLNVADVNGQNVVIETQLGQIKGLIHKPEGKQISYSFYGIQYGIAPINELRFRPLQLNTTKWNGIYDGTTFGPECMQNGKATEMSEDCLFLNIWTPKPNNTGTLLPVIFWIHGGGFSTGTGASYDATNLVGEGRDFVYVSINYRLGCFGFLQNQALYNEDPNWKSYGGMNGIYDQIQALKYVKQYISDYGGDPNHITIFGESAGGSSVCTLCISPLAKGLFKYAIIESGACNGPWGSQNATYGLQVYNMLLENAGYPIDNLTYLRSIPAQEFQSKMESWTWVVDELIISDQQKNIYANLKNNQSVFNADKLIFGFNTMDAYLVNDTLPTTNKEYETFLQYYINNSTQQDLLYSYYYPSASFLPYYGIAKYNSYELAWLTINCDVCLTCPSLLGSEQIDESINNNIVYVYQFGGPGNNSSYYAAHGSEVIFVYDSPKSSQPVPWSQILSNQMVSAWTNFAKYGIPNITDSIDNSNIDWIEFGGQSKSNVMILEDTVKIKPSFKQNYRNNVCDFWYNQIGFDAMYNICFGLPV